MKKTVYLAIGMILGSMATQAQYPVIPQSVQDSANKVMAEWQKKSDEAWEKALPIVEAEAKNGRPYVPWASQPSDLPQAKILAFPGAEGAGAHTAGGRGGKVYVVTTLADSGPGSFRDACEKGGARIIVFNVAGIIHLESPVSIRAPYVTIEG